MKDFILIITTNNRQTNLKLKVAIDNKLRDYITIILCFKKCYSAHSKTMFITNETYSGRFGPVAVSLNTLLKYNIKKINNFLTIINELRIQ